jgi:hypothetical protein
MPTFTTLKTEKNLLEVVERIYGTLDAANQARAQTALLRANPHLEAEAALRPGAVVHVPDVSGLRPRPAAGRDDPALSLHKELETAVAGLREQLSARLEHRAQELTQQAELLKSREIAAAIKQDPAGAEIAKNLAQALRDETKVVAEDRKRVADVFERIAADLQRIGFS